MDKPVREMKLGDLMENEDQVVRALAKSIERYLGQEKCECSFAKSIGVRTFSTVPKSRPPSSMPPRR